MSSSPNEPSTPSRFLILSMGRTATQWLAAQLMVPHEPKEFTGRAVSPKHLYMWLMKMWTPPMDMKFGVVVRHPWNQLLSVVNRAHALNKDPKARIKRFRTNAPGYIRLLENLVYAGHPVLRYEKMTEDRKYLQWIADYFECDLAEDRFEKRLNAFPTRKHGLDPEMEALAQRLDEVYAGWLSISKGVHDM